MRRGSELIELGCVDCVDSVGVSCLGQTGRGRIALSIDADLRNAQAATKRAYAIATQGEAAIVSPTQQELLKQLVQKTGEVAGYFRKAAYPTLPARGTVVIPGVTPAIVAREGREEIKQRSRRKRKIMEGIM